MKKSLIFMLIVLIGMVMLTSGCAKMRNEMASEGGFWGSVTGGAEGDYIIISQSGGYIMDVWKLKNVIVQSASSSDGWLFRDDDGNAINIGGDVKVIRVKNKDFEQWDKIYEYHMELESKSYRDKYFY